MPQKSLISPNLGGTPPPREGYWISPLEDQINLCFTFSWWYKPYGWPELAILWKNVDLPRTTCRFTLRRWSNHKVSIYHLNRRFTRFTSNHLSIYPVYPSIYLDLPDLPRTTSVDLPSIYPKLTYRSHLLALWVGKGSGYNWLSPLPTLAFLEINIRVWACHRAANTGAPGHDGAMRCWPLRFCLANGFANFFAMRVLEIKEALRMGCAMGHLWGEYYKSSRESFHIVPVTLLRAGFLSPKLAKPFRLRTGYLRDEPRVCVPSPYGRFTLTYRFTRNWGDVCGAVVVFV